MTVKPRHRASVRGHTLIPFCLAVACLGAIWLVLTLLNKPSAPSAGLQPESATTDSSEPNSYSKLTRSSLYDLQIDYYENYLPLTAAVGGAVVPIQSSYLLVNGDGNIFSFNLPKEGAQIEFKALPYPSPLNGDELDAAEIVDMPRNWFRVLDALAVEESQAISLYVSHHVWKPDTRCFVVRVSRLQADYAALLAGTANPDWTTLFESQPCLPLKEHGYVFMGQESGGRLGLKDNNTLLLTLGDLQFDGVHADKVFAQDPDASYGKTLAINIQDGSSRIFTTGHRNPQGLHVAPNGQIWSTEHGPRGGDELNLLVDGGNYGWPYVTYGTQYRVTLWPSSETQGRHEGYIKPVFAWVPSIAVSNLIEVQQDLFRWWQGDLLVGSLREESLYRMRMEEGRITVIEPIEIGGRIRDVVEAHDGRIIIWTDKQTLAIVQPVQDENNSKFIFDTECGACHRNDRPVARRRIIAPNLRNIYGAPAGAAQGYPYSAAMQAFAGDWTRERLDAFIANPTESLPGTLMQIEGISDPERRKLILDYLQSIKQDQ